MLKKKVNLVQLVAPKGVKWDETVKGKAVWSAVENASGYKVQLYKNDSEQGSEVALGTGATSYDFTSQIAEPIRLAFGRPVIPSMGIVKKRQVEPMYFPSRP